MIKIKKNWQYNREGYLKQYNLESIAEFHEEVFLDFNKRKVFSQSFLPPERKGIIFIVHGYLDHSAALANLIQFLVAEGFGVIAYDLPGHGLTYGERGNVEDFQEYEDVLHSIITYYKSKISKEDHVFAIGHSTGAGILMDYVRKANTHFEKVILVAPLVRPFLWSISKIGVKLFGKKLKYIKRKYRKNSGNKNYLRFVQKDPLQFKSLPTNWLFSLLKWNKSVYNAPMHGYPFYIIQGNKDNTVDWRHNISFLLNKYPKSTCILIDGGNHQLFNDQESIQSITFQHIKKILLRNNRTKVDKYGKK